MVCVALLDEDMLQSSLVQGSSRMCSSVGGGQIIHHSLIQGLSRIFQCSLFLFSSHSVLTWYVVPRALNRRLFK